MSKSFSPVRMVSMFCKKSNILLSSRITVIIYASYHAIVQGYPLDLLFSRSSSSLQVWLFFKVSSSFRGASHCKPGLSLWHATKDLFSYSYSTFSPGSPPTGPPRTRNNVADGYQWNSSTAFLPLVSSQPLVAQLQHPSHSRKMNSIVVQASCV